MTHTQTHAKDEPVKFHAIEGDDEPRTREETPERKPRLANGCLRLLVAALVLFILLVVALFILGIVANRYARTAAEPAKVETTTPEKSPARARTRRQKSPARAPQTCGCVEVKDAPESTPDIEARVSVLESRVSRVEVTTARLSATDATRATLAQVQTAQKETR